MTHSKAARPWHLHVHCEHVAAISHAKIYTGVRKKAHLQQFRGTGDRVALVKQMYQRGQTIIGCIQISFHKQVFHVYWFGWCKRLFLKQICFKAVIIRQKPNRFQFPNLVSEAGDLDRFVFHCTSCTQMYKNEWKTNKITTSNDFHNIFLFIL